MERPQDREYKSPLLCETRPVRLRPVKGNFTRNGFERRQIAPFEKKSENLLTVSIVLLYFEIVGSISNRDAIAHRSLRVKRLIYTRIRPRSIGELERRLFERPQIPGKDISFEWAGDIEFAWKESGWIFKDRLPLD